MTALIRNKGYTKVFLTLDLIVVGSIYCILSAFKTWKHGGLGFVVSFAIFLFIWFALAIAFDKFKIKERTLRHILLRLLISNAWVFFIFLILFAAFEEYAYLSNLIYFSIIINTVAEIQIAYYMKVFIKSPVFRDDLVKFVPRNGYAKWADLLSSQKITDPTKHKYLIDFAGEDVAKYIKGKISLDQSTLLLATTELFNIQNQCGDHLKNIVNLRQINDLLRINKFFEAVNTKLPKNGLYIGCVKTKAIRKRKILKKYPIGLNYIVYSIDFIFHRVLPKLPGFNQLYFFITKGKNRVITKTETLGRLYSCGFRVVEESKIGDTMFFIAQKIGQPSYDMNPSYGLFFRMRRIGLRGKEINVYKVRTMHPYSEYLQAYVYEKNKLAEGGKIQDDFRVSTMGKFFRKYWIDELPMLINLFNGDLKLVGVRPLSKHYLSLYDPDLQKRRLAVKPGLIPPFYADMPKTLEEIMLSEKTYIESYLKHPILTDIKYFSRAFYNIFVKKARSN